MRKFLLAAVATLALALPAAAPTAAQEAGDHDCITIDAVMARAADKQLPVSHTLRGADIGFEAKVDIIIFEATVHAGNVYLAFAFDRGCMVADAVLDQEGVETLINDNKPPGA